MSLDLNGQDGAGKENLPAGEISEKNENRGNAAEKFSSSEKPKETEEGTADEAKGYVFDFGDSANGTPPVADTARKTGATPGETDTETARRAGTHFGVKTPRKAAEKTKAFRPISMRREGECSPRKNGHPKRKRASEK